MWFTNPNEIASTLIDVNKKKNDHESTKREIETSILKILIE